jgi:hypothetical protein
MEPLKVQVSRVYRVLTYRAKCTSSSLDLDQREMDMGLD